MRKVGQAVGQARGVARWAERCMGLFGGGCGHCRLQLELSIMQNGQERLSGAQLAEVRTVLPLQCPDPSLPCIILS